MLYQNSMNTESAQIMSYVFKMDNKPGDIVFNTRERKDDRPTLQFYLVASCCEYGARQTNGESQALRARCQDILRDKHWTNQEIKTKIISWFARRTDVLMV